MRPNSDTFSCESILGLFIGNSFGCREIYNVSDLTFDRISNCFCKEDSWTGLGIFWQYTHSKKCAPSMFVTRAFKRLGDCLWWLPVGTLLDSWKYNCVYNFVLPKFEYFSEGFSYKSWELSDIMFKRLTRFEKFYSGHWGWGIGRRVVEKMLEWITF